MHSVPPHDTTVTLFSVDGQVRVFRSLRAAPWDEITVSCRENRN
ncbi:hypothetical protein IGB42_02567 [Andreprevotia sp. IGB-42]|nr:hypothetical protein IGB42_02567 [Andreprevotia sp. IGB-42]